MAVSSTVDDLASMILSWPYKIVIETCKIVIEKVSTLATSAFKVTLITSDNALVTGNESIVSLYVGSSINNLCAPERVGMQQVDTQLIEKTINKK